MNPWTRFVRLLPRDLPLIAEARTVHPDGTVTVRAQAGVEWRVTGSASGAGVWVVIVGGKIERELGNLAFLDLEV